ncbi:hypothetical protein PV10_07877 [Exophiala mesophila]|uniref:Palmitoyltransferase n=1 Tax=Exophiala mesophila TaxID=212818 RepID=A0A0D1XR81_EXOME|nr:uncharacterized protein PV10_07877 [Exophiala mesophila]KIV90591.1 hypothetical protein PV10_07877 [Exophiala mesophila]
MGIVRTIALVILTISFIVFVALFGRLPIFRRTPVHFLHSLLWIYIPAGLGIIDEKLTGRRLTNSLSSLANYLFNEAHPIVLVFFVLLQVAGEILFIPSAWSRFSPVEKLPVPFLVVAPYLFLYLSSTTSSNITDKNHQSAIRAYPYDYCLFHPGYFCSTCHFAKPARSKHCSLCKACVQRQDHHCIWINNCVGRNNYLWFNLLIASTAALIAYGALKGHSILDARLQAKFVPPALTRGSLTAKRWSTALTWHQWLQCWGWAIGVEWKIGAVMLLSAMSFPLATAFLVYHLYLVWAGMTTNESAKWAEWKEDVEDDLVWRAEIVRLRETYPRLPEDVEPSQTEGRWPAHLTARWWMVRTRDGTQPKHKTPGSQAPDDGDPCDEVDERWEKVESIKEVDNLYDQGFWVNLVDHLFNRGG